MVSFSCLTFEMLRNLNVLSLYMHFKIFKSDQLHLKMKGGGPSEWRLGLWGVAVGETGSWAGSLRTQEGSCLPQAEVREVAGGVVSLGGARRVPDPDHSRPGNKDRK